MSLKISSNKSVEKLVDSEQYRLSEIILDYRFNNGLTFHEMASFLNLTPEEYCDFEWANQWLPVEEYEKVINKLIERFDN